MDKVSLIIIIILTTVLCIIIASAPMFITTVKNNTETEAVLQFEPVARQLYQMNIPAYSFKPNLDIGDSVFVNADGGRILIFKFVDMKTKGEKVEKKKDESTN